MKNYQLYRTNVLLGGQLQLDLVTSSKSGARLRVDNAHLSPISPMVPFTYSPQENILLYEHKDNIREFYKKIEGSFYQPFVNPELSHDWPIIWPTKDTKPTDTAPKRYNDTYIYGCRRMPYDRYNEQFQILVPLWLEDVQESLRLVINIWSMVEDSNGKLVRSSNPEPVAHKFLEFRPDASGDDFDAKFSRYLFEYFRYIKIYGSKEQSGSQVINIDFDGTSSVHGLEVTSGNLTTKELPSIVDNILYRERPLMEVDNMIIESFKNNHMICKQLVNFGVCFSMQDFITPSLTKELLGSPFQVSVDVYVDGKQLDKKDFFNNYEEIGLHTISEQGSALEIQDDPDTNTLSYLKDYSCLDLIDKNKLSQNIIHWSVGGQNDYIFNVYGGFGSRDANSDRRNTHYYDVYPNALDQRNASGANNYNWLNRMSATAINDILLEQNRKGRDPKTIRGYLPLAKQMTAFSSNGGEMIHGLKYLETLNDDEIDTVYIMFAYGASGCALGKKLCSIPRSSSPQNDIIVWDVLGNVNSEMYSTTYLSSLSKSKMYVLLVDDQIDQMSMVGYLKKFFSQNPDVAEYKYLEAWSNVVESAVAPETIKFTRGLACVCPDSPSKDTVEFQYVKKDINVNNYVVRYDGLISPTFIDVEGDSLWKNKVYYKSMLKMDEFAGSPFSTYGGSGYEPLYPSIGYFAIQNKSLDEEHYKNLDVEGDKLYVSDERPWFDNSQILYVQKELQMVVEVNLRDVEDVDAEIERRIEEEIGRVYGVSGDYLTSIYKLYSQEIDWEYVSTTDIYTYNYYITLKLK